MCNLHAITSYYYSYLETMGQAIILNFPPQVARDEKDKLIQTVNSKLADITKEVNNWNGFVELIRKDDNNFKFIAKCDNDVILIKMQGLLDAI